jgi:hypothetical protein
MALYCFKISEIFFFSRSCRKIIVKMEGTVRQKWDVENMSRAVMSLKNDDCSQLQASKIYNVPRQTLQRYLLKDEFKVPKLGRKLEMGVEAEDDLRYLILRQEYGFGLKRTELRSLAFDFMEKLGVDHRFNKVNKMAGWEWMYSFLKRHLKKWMRQHSNDFYAPSFDAQVKRWYKSISVGRGHVEQYILSPGSNATYVTSYINYDIFTDSHVIQESYFQRKPYLIGRNTNTTKSRIITIKRNSNVFYNKGQCDSCIINQ